MTDSQQMAPGLLITHSVKVEVGRCEVSLWQ